jgi:regulator of sigma E protease
LSWFLAFAGFALLIVLHEAGHFAAAKAVGMRVERFSLFFPPLIARKTIGETEYAIGMLPLGGYVKITGMNPSEDLPDEVRTRAYWSQPVWKRIVVIAAGPAVNLVLAFIGLLVYFAVIGVTPPSNRVDRVEPGFPAAEVIRPGDRVLAVDGRRGTPNELRNVVAGHRCPGSPVDGCRAAEPARVLVDRDGRRVSLTVTPVFDRDTGGMRLGFSYVRPPRETSPLGPAIAQSGEAFVRLTWETIKLPARVFDSEKRKDISGVVGSYEITRQTILVELEQVVPILALISLSLAVVNLFPFLPLDGGHIFWAIVEKVRGRPVSYGLMERSSVLGFVLVMGLFLLGLNNDIGRLTGEGFGIR